ncbi:hypothetical protein TRVL_07967 [Trypanosoma vivax]|nr:hypothetical protein TRVL_07967 [Trypanosoma vivax]
MTTEAMTATPRGEDANELLRRLAVEEGSRCLIYLFDENEHADDWTGKEHPVVTIKPQKLRRKRKKKKLSLGWQCFAACWGAYRRNSICSWSGTHLESVAPSSASACALFAASSVF